MNYRDKTDLLKLQWGYIYKHLKHKSLHKYTRVARSQDGVEVVKSMIDLVLMKKDMMYFVQDVRAVRGMG